MSKDVNKNIFHSVNKITKYKFLTRNKNWRLFQSFSNQIIDSFADSFVGIVVVVVAAVVAVDYC